MPRKVSPDGPWADRHRLVNFYAPDDLRAWIDEEMRRTGKSKTQVIVEALEEVRTAHRSRSRDARRPPTGR